MRSEDVVRPEPRAPSRSALVPAVRNVYPDGQVAGVPPWVSGGEFAWWELHDTFTDGTAKRFPGTSDLKTWEQHGQSLFSGGRPTGW